MNKMPLLSTQYKATAGLHVPLVCLLLSLLTSSYAGSLEEWRSRSVYQIVTDRFSTFGPSPPDCDLSTYCGGSFAGITRRLGYIKKLGFDAIWISPVVANTVSEWIERPDASAGNIVLA